MNGPLLPKAIRTWLSDSPENTKVEAANSGIPERKAASHVSTLNPATLGAS